MILYPYFELAASLFILLFALELHLWHHENRAARFFVRCAVVSFLACIMVYSLRIAFTLELAAFIDRIATCLTTFSFAMYLHFAIIFTRRESFFDKKWALPLFYTPPAIVALLALCTNLIYNRYDIFAYGIIGQPSSLYFVYALQTMLYTFWGIVLFFIYSRQAIQPSVRNQSLAIAIGTLIPVSIGVVFDQILPIIFGFHVFPPTVIFDYALMIFFIYLAMRRYSLFAISPSLAAKQIIETMPDSLLVTDLDGRIIFVNNEAHKFFHVDKAEIHGRNIKDLFTEKENYEKLYDEVVNKKLKIERFGARLCDPRGECIPSLINSSLFRDDFGALLGIIFICRDVRG
ncbi:MAG: PAS domain-containing protein [Candidatus Margulisiibacteriota bacterium]